MKPLEGVLVVAIEQAVAAPTCTVRLADAGARVIKIERPGGETARHYDNSVLGHSAYFAWLNRGKESAVLDLTTPGDRALLDRLLAKADVFVRNTVPGGMQRLGLGAAAMVAKHARLIVVDIVGYGQDTPCRDMKAYDLLIQAESGIAAVTGTPDAPCRVGVSIADVGTGMNAHAAVLQALMLRERTGRGQSLEIVLFDSMADLMSVPLLQFEHAGTVTRRLGLEHAAIAPYRAYACRDGEIVISVQDPAHWRRFCAGVLRDAALAGDPRFASNPARVENRVALDAIIAPVFAAGTVKEMIARLDAAGLAWGRVSGIADLSRHPALRRQTVRAGERTFEAVAPPVPVVFDAPPALPELGEHTEAIRREFMR